MHKLYFLIILCFIVTISNQALAACTNPTKSEGTIIYNTDHKVAQFCNGTQWIGMAGGSTSIMTGDTMVEGWPDAIQCSRSDGTEFILIINLAPASSGDYYYVEAWNGSSVYLRYNASGALVEETLGSTNSCQGKSISQLYTDGQAFNFVGGQPVITDTLSDLNCSDGQMVLYDTATTAWICADVTASGAADNLGDHTATQNLNLANFEITNAAGVTLDSVTGGAAPVSSSDNGVPSGAVMAFDLASCPTGWSEYTAARGRFLRGIDSTGANDPDGVRTAGSVQGDLVGPHIHPFAQPQGTLGGQFGLVDSADSGSSGTPNTALNSGVETRPVNVAVLFCRKD